MSYHVLLIKLLHESAYLCFSLQAAAMRALYFLGASGADVVWGVSNLLMIAGSALRQQQQQQEMAVAAGSCGEAGSSSGNDSSRIMRSPMEQVLAQEPFAVMVSG